MKKLFSLTLTLAMLTAAGSTQAAQTKEVTYRSGADTVSGFLALPASSGKHPALIVIHEWWGLNSWVKSEAAKFAREGYVALAVDLYRGKSAGDNPEIAHELMRGLPEDRAARDLRAAFSYLAERPDVDPERIGSIGWCMGGGYSLETAILEPRLAACVMFYGRLVTDPATIVKIHSPILGNFGALDRGISPESVRAFEQQARRDGKVVDFKIYPDAGHAFASSRDSKVFRTEDARDANARTDAFLGKYLKK